LFDSFFGTSAMEARVKMLSMQSGLKAFTLRFFAFLITLILGLCVGLVRHIYDHRQGMFTSAAFMGHRFQMKAAYALGIDVNAAACEFRSCFNAVWGAAYGGYDDEIQFLVERGADVNARPATFRTTALMVASYKGNESTVRLLLSHGSDPNAIVEGETALSYAKQKGHLEIVQLLRQAGASEGP
jgi:FOG: Ankyrin repeat